MTQLKALREKAGITQKRLADSIGVTQGAVAQWENGLTNPKFEHLRAIAQALGSTVGELLGEKEAC